MYEKQLLSILKKRKPKQNIRTFIYNLSQKEINALEYITKLFLRGKIKIPKKNFAKIKKYKKILRKIAFTKTKSLSTKKKLLSQTGGSVFSLIPLAISALANLFK